MPYGFDVVAPAAADFPAALVVVQHLDPRHRSLMADILNRRTAMPVQILAPADLAQSLGDVEIGDARRYARRNEFRLDLVFHHRPF